MGYEWQLKWHKYRVVIEWEWGLSEGILWGDRKVLSVARSVLSFLNLCLKFCWFLCWRKMILIQSSLPFNLPFYLPSKFDGFLIFFLLLNIISSKNYYVHLVWMYICVHGCEHVCVCAYTQHGIYMKVRGQLIGVGSLFHFMCPRDGPQVHKFGSRGLLSTEPSCQPSVIFFFLAFVFCTNFSVWLKPVCSARTGMVWDCTPCVSPRFLMSPHTALHWAVDFLSTKGSACFPVHLSTPKAKA